MKIFMCVLAVVLLSITISEKGLYNKKIYASLFTVAIAAMIITMLIPCVAM